MIYEENLEETRLIEPPKKQIFRLQIPYTLRFALVWTIFFAIIGIAIQFYQTVNPVFKEVIKDFFTINYNDWFRSFGSFANPVEYESRTEIFYVIKQWYYFFYTGGLIALLWGILSWLINLEIVFKRKSKYEKLKEEAAKQKEQLAHNLRINELLVEGRKMLAESNIQEAKASYNEIRQIYEPGHDKDGKLKQEVLSFYNEILEEEKNLANPA